MDDEPCTMCGYKLKMNSPVSTQNIQHITKNISDLVFSYLLNNIK